MKEVIRNSNFILFHSTSFSDYGQYFVKHQYFPCFLCAGLDAEEVEKRHVFTRLE